MEASTSSILRSLPFCSIYQDGFEAVDKKTKGVGMGAIYELRHTSKWMGKMGDPQRITKDPPFPKAKLLTWQINLGAILEKIGRDLYSLFAKGRFIVPPTYLSRLKTINPFIASEKAKMLLVDVEESLQVMSKMVNGYNDLATATIRVAGEKVKFTQFIETYHRFPEKILTSKGEEVPLEGSMEMLAAIRLLADTDGIGGDARNAGFIWMKDGKGKIVAARCVKIDPGYSFQFVSLNKNHQSNRVLKTLDKVCSPSESLKDLKDIQVANANTSLTIVWNNMLSEQKITFLESLKAMIELIISASDKDLRYIFYRKGAFNRIDVERMFKADASVLGQELKEWALLQQKVYFEDT